MMKKVYSYVAIRVVVAVAVDDGMNLDSIVSVNQSLDGLYSYLYSLLYSYLYSMTWTSFLLLLVVTIVTAVMVAVVPAAMDRIMASTALSLKMNMNEMVSYALGLYQHHPRKTRMSTPMPMMSMSMVSQRCSIARRFERKMTRKRWIRYR